ncbi:MAG TPA: Hsp20/alpha crystallin family protein [Candidatus Binatia bacterium]
MSTTAEKTANLSSDRAPAPVERPRERVRVVAPYVDVYETKDAYHLRADVPGVAEKDLDVSVEKDRLTIVGRVEMPQREGMRLRFGELRSREYRRSFGLADDIDRDRIEAKLENGVLYLTLPKREDVRPRRITVQAA